MASTPSLADKVNGFVDLFGPSIWDERPRVIQAAAEGPPSDNRPRRIGEIAMTEEEAAKAVAKDIAESSKEITDRPAGLADKVLDTLRDWRDAANIPTWPGIGEDIQSGFGYPELADKAADDWKELERKIGAPLNRLAFAVFGAVFLILGIYFLRGNSPAQLVRATMEGAKQ